MSYLAWIVAASAAVVDAVAACGFAVGNCVAESLDVASEPSEWLEA